MTVPTVGRIVHYTTRLGHEKAPLFPRAAIITAVSPNLPGITINEECNYKVALCVLSMVGFEFFEEIPYSREPMANHWSWPPIAVGVKI